MSLFSSSWEKRIQSSEIICPACVVLWGKQWKGLSPYKTCAVSVYLVLRVGRLTSYKCTVHNKSIISHFLSLSLSSCHFSICCHIKYCNNQITDVISHSDTTVRNSFNPSLSPPSAASGNILTESSTPPPPPLCSLWCTKMKPQAGFLCKTFMGWGKAGALCKLSLKKSWTELELDPDIRD